MNTVTVKINGMEYNLKGKENQEYLIDLSGYVDGKLREIMIKNSKLSSTAVAVLACLNIGDELYKCDREAADLIEKVKVLEERDLKYIKRIEEITEEVKKTSDIKDKEINNLKNVIKSMEENVSKVDNLNEKIRLLTHELKEMELLKQKIESSNIQTKALKENLNIKEIECEKHKENATRLGKEIIEVKDDMSKEVKSELKRSNELKNELEKLNGQANSYKEKLKIKEIECEKYKENAIKLNEEITEVKDVMEEQYNNVKNELKQIDVLKAEVDTLNIENVSYKEQLKLKQMECGKYKENTIKLSNDIMEIKDIMNEEHNSLKREILLLNSGNDDLRSAVEDSYSKIASLEEENNNLLKEKDRLSKEIIDKENEIKASLSIEEENRYKQEIENLEKQIVIMEEELKFNIKIKEKLQNRSKEMHFQMQNSKFKVLDLEKKLIDIQIELAKSKRDKSLFLK